MQSVAVDPTSHVLNYLGEMIDKVIREPCVFNNYRMLIDIKRNKRTGIDAYTFAYVQHAVDQMVEPYLDGYRTTILDHITGIRDPEQFLWVKKEYVLLVNHMKGCHPFYETPCTLAELEFRRIAISWFTEFIYHQVCRFGGWKSTPVYFLQAVRDIFKCEQYHPFKIMRTSLLGWANIYLKAKHTQHPSDIYTLFALLDINGIKSYIRPNHFDRTLSLIVYEGLTVKMQNDMFECTYEFGAKRKIRGNRILDFVTSYVVERRTSTSCQS